MLKRPDQRALHAHIWIKDPDGFYVEPYWCGERLFAVERSDGLIQDPACGLGRIADAARAAGYNVIATDLVDRGYPQFDGVEDFFRSERRVDNMVCNPPYNTCRAFAEHALKLARRKVAMIWLARRLNAARWLANTPLARVYLLTPRPSMPPGHVILAGEEPGGGTQDFVWLTFSHGHQGPPELKWLCREKTGGRSMGDKDKPSTTELVCVACGQPSMNGDFCRACIDRGFFGVCSGCEGKPLADVEEDAS